MGYHLTVRMTDEIVVQSTDRCDQIKVPDAGYVLYAADHQIDRERLTAHSQLAITR